jgi:hypothetical protein
MRLDGRQEITCDENVERNSAVQVNAVSAIVQKPARMKELLISEMAWILQVTDLSEDL